LPDASGRRFLGGIAEQGFGMLAIQVVVEGRCGPVVRGFASALMHAGDALLGTRGDAAALDAAILALREAQAPLAGVGVPCGLGHLLRRCARELGADVELVWHDTEAAPGAGTVALRYGFRDAADPAFLVFDALADAAGPDGDPAAAAAALRLGVARVAAVGIGGTARARHDHLRRIQCLFAGERGNPLGLVPGDAEIAGDHAGSLAALPDRAVAAFETFASGFADAAVAIR
jgi:hypothetical protein